MPRKYLLPLVIFDSVALVLAVALFFVCATARDNARRSSCRSNIKQLNLALAQYAQDYNGQFPAGSGACNSWPDSHNKQVSGCGWTQSVMEYTKSQSLYYCPSDATAHSWPTQTTSYWLNGKLMGYTATGIARPSQTFLLGEGDLPDVAGPNYLRSSLSPWMGANSTPITRHRGGANYLFADGHIAFLTPNQAVHFGGRADPFAVR